METLTFGPAEIADWLRDERETEERERATADQN